MASNDLLDENRTNVRNIRYIFEVYTGSTVQLLRTLHTIKSPFSLHLCDEIGVFRIDCNDKTVCSRVRSAEKRAIIRWSIILT